MEVVKKTKLIKIINIIVIQKKLDLTTLKKAVANIFMKLLCQSIVLCVDTLLVRRLNIDFNKYLLLKNHA